MAQKKNKKTASSKTKKKKKAVQKKRKSTQQRQQQPSMLWRLCRWIIVIGIWSSIALSLLLAWYAAELPGIINSPHFERKASIIVKDQKGDVVHRYGEIKGLSVKVEDLPPHLIYAVLSTEDRRFYKHFGIDLIGIGRAFITNIKAGRSVQGGSTITQQLAKNLFLSPDRTLKRKIQEAFLALWLESQLTKDEILSAYLNRVYLGSGAYGVDAASQIYFNKPADSVTLREAALLAGLLKAPSRYSPHSNPTLAAKRAKVVFATMRDAGYLTEEEARTQSLLTPIPRKKPNQAGSVHHFSDWVVAGLDDMIGSTAFDLTVSTTLDNKLQKEAEAILSQTLRTHGETYNVTQGALVIMAHDGAILTMVGGRDYQTSQFNRATQAKRPPGSAFKPIVYLTALEGSWESDDYIEDAPITKGRYRPRNYKKEYLGEVTLHYALSQSLNTPTVRLARDVGINAILDTAHKLGIETAMEPDLSLSLGSSGIPLIEMTRAYTVIANGGYSVTPYTVTRIEDKEGRMLYGRSLPAFTPVFDADSIVDLDLMLQSVIAEGTGRRAILPYRAAGKTGTSQDFRDAWFAGYTDKYVAVVWLGNDDNSSTKGLTGGSLPAGIWRDVMYKAHKSRNAARYALPASLKHRTASKKIARYTSYEQEKGKEKNVADSFNSMMGRIFND